ncbi:MAG: Integral rane sensor signal transduction histidine kinase [Pedosphaera sp.]|nr:Integral rane sensor signal transduction histidine kinase [Pedosphaera sp.]
MAQSPSPELTTAAAVRSLTVEQASQKTRVHLRGVVTFYDSSFYSRFIQDETSGIYLYDSGLPIRLVPGDLVEVDGTTSPGEYAPIVVPESIKVVGNAPLPQPKRVTYELLASGQNDSQFVEIVGTVRSVQVQLHEAIKYYLIEVATGGGRVSVCAPDLPVKRAEALLDSKVRVRGVCSTQFNRQRQLFAIRLMVPRPDDLVIEQPVTEDPFAIKARPIGSLLQFTPQGSFDHRVKLEGTVIYFEPGHALFVQDVEQGIEVRTKSREPLQLGDRVEVLGYVGQGEYTPTLQDAIYRKLASGALLSPATLTTDEVLKGKHDVQLIQITARLLSRALDGSQPYLILQDGDIIFHAYLRSPEGQDSFAHLQNGSLVSVSGVCRIDPGDWEAGETWRAKSFSIQLRLENDVVLLRSPSWWTLGRVLWIAGALGLVALAAFGWVGILRRKIAERTRELEIQIQKRQLAERRREIEQERARVAHDLHDDLGSGLTEVNMLTTLTLSATTSAKEKEGYLGALSEIARHMVTSLDEIVWAVNPRNDTIASLASYFGAYAQRLLDLASISCGLAMAEDLPEHPLNPMFRQELFFAFKESLTNVVRHARATQVRIGVSVRDGFLMVEVADDGCGFVLCEPQAGEDGIANMKARLETLGGQCEITSQAHKGTTVRFRAPLPEDLL